jgi:hypothetical protein
MKLNEMYYVGKAVGVRNFPQKGIKAESFLRECNEKEISTLGGYFLPDNEVCVDFGCGTGKCISLYCILSS